MSRGPPEDIVDAWGDFTDSLDILRLSDVQMQAKLRHFKSMSWIPYPLYLSWRNQCSHDWPLRFISLHLAHYRGKFHEADDHWCWCRTSSTLQIRLSLSSSHRTSYLQTGWTSIRPFLKDLYKLYFGLILSSYLMCFWSAISYTLL